MGFFSDFFGGSTRSDLRKAKKKSDAALTAGDEQATAAYNNAMAVLDPYAESGRKADDLYSRAIGLEGRDAAAGVADEFKQFDPFRAENAMLADTALQRAYNSRGGYNSGASRLAVARANLERGATDWNNWLDRLMGAKGQGVQVAGTQAGIQTGLGDQKFGLGQLRAGNEINYGNAMAGSRNIGINNLLGTVGTAIKAFTPYPGGSAIGNAMKTVGGWFGR